MPSLPTAQRSYDAHNAPLALISINDKPLPAEVVIQSVEIVDKRGIEPDELNISLIDTQDALPLPTKKAKVTAQLGWLKTGLTEKGVFTVSAVAHSGAPDVLTIRAISADLSESFKQPRKRSWSAPTLGDIVNEIAADHGWQAVISDDLAGLALSHLEQHDESDANLLTRLGEQYDCVATVKDDHLVFMPAGRGLMANGEALDTIVINRHSADTHDFNRDDDAGSVTGVQAYWRDTKAKKRKIVKVGEDGQRRHIKQTFASEAEATDAANARWARIQRGASTFSTTLTRGRPELIVESPVQLRGYKTEIDAIQWVARQARHTYDANGLLSHIELEQLIE